MMCRPAALAGRMCATVPILLFIRGGRGIVDRDLLALSLTVGKSPYPLQGRE